MDMDDACNQNASLFSKLCFSRQRRLCMHLAETMGEVTHWRGVGAGRYGPCAHTHMHICKDFLWVLFKLKGPPWRGSRTWMDGEKASKAGVCGGGPLGLDKMTDTR